MAVKLWGNVVNKTGMAVGLPTKMNATPDAFFSTILYRGSVGEQAVSMAESLGLKGDEFKNFVSEKIARPTVMMHEKALDHAQTNTFSKALDLRVSWEPLTILSTKPQWEESWYLSLKPVRTSWITQLGIHL
jgi:hypothetical protein